MSVPKATLFAAIVNAVAKLPEPSKSPVPVTSPVNDRVLAVVRAAAVVAVAAFPVVSWLPAALTPGKLMFAEPSNDTPPIVLAVARAVAVSALPVTLPVTLPTKVAFKDLFMFHLSSADVYVNVADAPSTVIPAPLAAAASAAPCATVMLRSATVNVVELTVDVVPCTVRFPVTVKASLTCTIPVPLPANTRLVSVDFDVSESDKRPEPNEIPLPAELVILLPFSICKVVLTATRPEPVASNSTLPDPEVCTETFWLASAEILIVPELSSITFCPLTYSDPGPTYKSLHCKLDAPSANVSSAVSYTHLRAHET